MVMAMIIKNFMIGFLYGLLTLGFGYIVLVLFKKYVREYRELNKKENENDKVK